MKMKEVSNVTFRFVKRKNISKMISTDSVSTLLNVPNATVNEVVASAHRTKKVRTLNVTNATEEINASTNIEKKRNDKKTSASKVKTRYRQQNHVITKLTTE